MTTVLIRRNAPNDSCQNLTALMSRCTKTSFIITPHYICAHRNPDNLHNAAFGEWRMRTLLWSYACLHRRVCLRVSEPRRTLQSIIYVSSPYFTVGSCYIHEVSAMLTWHSIPFCLFASKFLLSGIRYYQRLRARDMPRYENFCADCEHLARTMQYVHEDKV